MARHHAEAPAAGLASVEVRTARPDEYTAAGDLTANLYAAEGFAHGAYVDVLRDAARRAVEADLLVAVASDGHLLGTVTYASGGAPYADIAGPDEAEFRMLVVHPAARRRGVGEHLVRACVERARTQGKHRLVLSTDPRMRAAHRLYERLGFTRAPERDWSPEPGLTLRVYALHLVPTRSKRIAPA